MTPTHEEALGYLRQHFESSIRIRESMRQSMNGPNGKYLCFEDYVLREGKPYAPAVLTKAELAIVRAAMRKSKCDFPQKECYSNSQTLVMADKTGQLRYAEGYALGVIPVLHGWASINGKVVDLTLRTREENGEYRRPGRPFQDRVIGDFPPQRAYWGAEFDAEMVRQLMLRRDYLGSFIDDWKNDWQLMRTGSLL
jgi:hypothetical protein